MNKGTPLILAILILLISSLACQAVTGLAPRSVRGSGNVVTEDRNVSGFTGIDLASIGNAVIEIGQDEGLSIQAEDNLMQYIQTEVRGNTLEIRNQNNLNFQPREQIIYTITVANLEELTISGLGSVDAPDLQADNFQINISGGGDVEISSLEASTLDVDISGLGNLFIRSGQVNQQDVHISGSGDFRALDMQSQRARVQISGLGSSSLWVTTDLEVNISGGGSVRYKGNPTVQEELSGLGRVEKIEE
jgi:hypothetical protein